MKIAVLADTHGRLPQAVANAVRTADEIWHLGDFTEPTMVTALRGLGPPFFGVRGNCDSGLDLPETLRLERAGQSFLLIHIPPANPAGADFLLHGHTHVPRDEMVNGVRVLNPGTIGKPNHGAPPSYAWLDLDDVTGAATWGLVRV